MTKTMKIKHFFKMGNPVVVAFLLGFISMTACAFWLKKELPGAVVSNDLNNEMMVGMDNPLTILTRNIPAEKLSVIATGATLEQQNDLRWIARVKQVGPVLINVSDGGQFNQTFRFWARPEPYPVPLLGARHASKAIGNGEFKAQAGIAAVMNCCDIDACWEVVGYEVAYVPEKGPMVELSNNGARFEAPVQEVINKAAPGDMYFFDNIRVLCPGDQAARNLGGLSFRIK